MITLGIDSSAVAGSAAVLRDGRLLAEIYSDVGLTHSETLAPAVQRALQEAEVSPRELDLLAVSVGPGSFTGIRIGVALAKGIAFPFDTPTAGVSSTRALAHPLGCFPGAVAAVLDARRGRVFCGVYRQGREVCPPKLLEIEELPELLGPGPAMLVGDGAELCYNQLKGRGEFSLAPAMLRQIRASAVAELGELAASRGETVPAGELRPLYIQPSQAERTLLEKQALKK